MNQLHETFGNRQFAYFLATAVPLFVVAVTAVEALGLSSFWAFTAGTVFAAGLDPVANWCLDWRDLSEKTDSKQE